jgi:addiction module HigA family antidote
MANDINGANGPDYAIAPGLTLLETLEELGMSQAELAERTGRPLKTINEIAKGKTAITPETALQFEKVLGVPASFWNNLETQYREAIAAKEDRDRLSNAQEWVSMFPVSELIKRKCIQKTNDSVALARQLLRFFGVSSPEAWKIIWLRPEAAYRKSPAFEMSRGAMAAWLRMGELQAQKVKCLPFDRSHFRKAIDHCRMLASKPVTRVKDELVEACSKAGVAIVFTAELPGTHVSGATRWVSPQKALIQLSCRYKADDHFWFTFFHECGHVFLHGKKDVFIEDQQTSPELKEREAEANAFAANLLVPTSELKSFADNWNNSEEELLAFAETLNVCPGVVVGQLQFNGVLRFSQYNQLKCRVDLFKRSAA